MRILLSVMVILIAGCAHVVAPDLRAQADKTLTPEALFSDPELHRGKTVIAGGVIIQTNIIGEETDIEVLEKPLDSRGRPLDSDISRGRFIVIHSERLDPAIFSPGREVTVVAQVQGIERRPLGDIEYPYLKLRSKAVYIHRYSAKGRQIPIRFGVGIFHSF